MNNTILNLIKKSRIAVLAIITFSIVYTANCQMPVNDILTQKAPEKFSARFETTKGIFEIQAERNLSPLAVDRLYQLIQSNYFADIPFYRAVKDFVVQFGSMDSTIDNEWSKHIIPDEPVKASNTKGAMSFARAGKETRGTQLFINLKDNSRLDTVSYGETLGFPVIARVTKGLDVIDSIYTGYKDAPRELIDSTVTDIPAFLKTKFPKLDYIIKASVIRE